MSLDSHVRELCKANLNIPELHMPADSVSSPQLNPQLNQGNTVTIHWVPGHVDVGATKEQRN